MGEDYTPAHEPGDLLDHDKYRLERILGVGSFGEVWLATHVHLGTRVAIKIMHASFTSRISRRRFEREARVAMKLAKHKNIVGARDLIVANNMLAIVMESIDGGPTLYDYLKEWTASEREALRLTKWILNGLIEAHKNGILHRDLKPANVLLKYVLEGMPNPMISDFGIAGSTEGETDDSSRSTRDGQQMGTPGYVAFEQWVNARLATARSDLYAVGVMLAEMVGVSPLGLTMSTMGDTINPQKRAEWLASIPYPRIRAIVERAAEAGWIDGNVVPRRYASAVEMHHAVEDAMAQASEDPAPRIPRNDATMVPALDPHTIQATPAPEGGTAIPDGEAAEVSRKPETPRPVQRMVGTYLTAEEDWKPPPARWKQPVGVAVVLLILGGIVGMWWWSQTRATDVIEREEVVTHYTYVPPLVQDTATPEDSGLPDTGGGDETGDVVEAVQAPITAPVVVTRPVATNVPDRTPEPIVTPPETAPVTEVKVTLVDAPTSVSAEGVLNIEARVSVPASRQIKSVTLRYRGEGGGAWQSRPMAVNGNVARSTIKATASMGTQVTYYVDARTADDPGTPIKSPSVTAEILP